MEDKEIKKDLDRLRPLLEAIRRERETQPDDAYFSGLASRALRRAQPAKRVRLWPHAAAAAVLLLVIAGVAHRYRTSSPDPAPHVADAEIINYVESHLSEFSDEDLAVFVSPDDSDEDILDAVDVDDMEVEDILSEETLN